MTRYQLLVSPTFHPIVLAPNLEAAIAARPKRDRESLTQALPTTNEISL
jgi:hypothetical protein